MSIIYHITRRADWQAALAAHAYTADSLASEGFIHCSTAQQVLRFHRMQQTAPPAA